MIARDVLKLFWELATTARNIISGSRDVPFPLTRHRHVQQQQAALAAYFSRVPAFRIIYVRTGMRQLEMEYPDVSIPMFAHMSQRADSVSASDHVQGSWAANSLPSIGG